jgi:REP element-mobilizing transposase RayT
VFLDLLGKEVRQQGWICYAYCLMGNHYHLLIETPQPNLVRGMRRLNGVYTQAFNRRHARVGHVLQGRYKAVLVDKESYLLELCRYVVLNPVRAKLVRRPEDWPWSSYRTMVSKAEAAEWLAVEKVLSFFSGRLAYRRFVAGGVGQPSVWRSLRGQIYLGGKAFLHRMQRLVQGKPVRGVARMQVEPLRPRLDEILSKVSRAFRISPSGVLQRSDQDAYQAAVYLLRRAANLSLREVAELAGVSSGRISQIQAKIERQHPRGTLAGLLRNYKVKP